MPLSARLSPNANNAHRLLSLRDAEVRLSYVCVCLFVCVRARVWETAFDLLESSPFTINSIPRTCTSTLNLNVASSHSHKFKPQRGKQVKALSTHLSLNPKP